MPEIKTSKMQAMSWVVLFLGIFSAFDLHSMFVAIFVVLVFCVMQLLGRSNN